MVIAILIAVIWIFVELKRFKHKIFAMLLIAVILFSYFGFVMAIKGQEIDFKSVDGLKTAGGLYWAWLGNIFGNFKSMTTHAIKLDWKGDQNIEENKPPKEKSKIGKFFNPDSE